MTLSGFYSVVQDCQDSRRLLIRARACADLRALGLPGIQHTPKADYPYRLSCTRDDWQRCLQAFGKNIQYTNFKSAVGQVDTARAKLYEQVWRELYKIERERR